MTNRRFAFLLLSTAAIVSPSTKAAAQEAPAPVPILASQDLSQLSIEELAQLPVRSASKREEPLGAAPTALFIITKGDIHDTHVESNDTGRAHLAQRSAYFGTRVRF